MNLSMLVCQYVAHQRSLGKRFQTEEALLRTFCKAVGDGPIASVKPQAVLAYLNGVGPVTEYWARKHRALSGLYRFATARGLASVVPLPRVVARPTVPPFVPYIYAEAELKRLLGAVPAACAGRVPIDDHVFRTLLLVLYGAGLRLSEALALTIGDVDLPAAMLRIGPTKFYKTRIVPMGKDLTRVVAEYAAQRNQRHCVATEAPFFCFDDGTRLSKTAAQRAFRRLRSHAGVQCAGGARRQPRLHDLRHAAAVHRLIAWYRSGADLHQLLPKLATYLGHVDLSATQRYLTLTPALLEQASLRFERFAMEADHD